MIALSKGQLLRTACVALAVVVSPVSARLRAQVPAQQSTSVMDDILKRAEDALNDLNYKSAIDFAKQVVDVGPRATPAQRTRALFVIGAANYPEGEPTAQHRDIALATFKQLVSSNFDLVIPQTIRWAGLDSLLSEAKRTTYAIAMTAVAEQIVTGPAGRAEVKVRASRPSTFRMTVSPSGGGAPLVSDSLSGTSDGALHFPTMRNERPIFTTGDYDVLVTAADAQSSDTTSTRYTAHITAPELTFAKIPVAIDSSRLQFERSGRYGAKGIIVGALVAGGIYAFSNVVRADTMVKRVVPADSKGAGVAAAAGAAVIIASFMDKGRQIPGAIAANQRLRTDLAASIRATEAENANRIATYRTTIAIQTGAQ
jgi:hypothetical protein